MCEPLPEQETFRVRLAFGRMRREDGASCLRRSPCLETARRESNPGPLANRRTMTPVGTTVVTRPRAAFPRYSTSRTVALGWPLPARLTAITRYSRPTPRG